MADPRSLDRHLRGLHRRPVGRPRNGRYDDINPATEAVIARLPTRAALRSTARSRPPGARSTAGPWADAGAEQRAAVLNQLGEALLEHADEFFALAQLEWGCTANERVIHVDGPAFVALNAAELATHPVEEQIDGIRCGGNHAAAL